MNKFLKKSVQECIAYDHDDRMRYHLTAIIVRGGSIISIGHNSTTVNSFVRRFFPCEDGVNKANLHAEVDAVLKARKKTDLNGCKIYVARVLRNGDVAMARPCIHCTKVLEKHGIKRAIYTIANNEYGVLSL